MARERKWSFDDGHIGTMHVDADSLLSKEIPRPRNYNQAEWYKYASEVAKALNHGFPLDPLKEISDGEIYSLASFGGDRKARDEFVESTMAAMIDPRTGRPLGDHGTANQAIQFVLNSTHDDTLAFLKSWNEGDLDEWPEFYQWLKRQPRSKD